MLFLMIFSSFFTPFRAAVRWYVRMVEKYGVGRQSFMYFDLLLYLVEKHECFVDERYFLINSLKTNMLVLQTFLLFPPISSLLRIAVSVADKCLVVTFAFVVEENHYVRGISTLSF